MASRKTYDGLTVQAGAEEAERWLSNFIPSLEYLEQNADLAEPKREYLARLISALFEAKANALLVRSECVRERSVEAVKEIEPFTGKDNLPRYNLRKMILTWIEQDRIQVVDGVVCVRVNRMQGRRVRETYRPLTERMLKVYDSIRRDGGREE